MKNTFAAIKYWMDKILSIACAILLSFMTILVLIQVFSRYVLNSPVAFTEELVRYSLIWTGFIGAAGHPPQPGLRHRPDFRRVHCDCADHQHL